MYAMTSSTFKIPYKSCYLSSNISHLSLSSLPQCPFPVLFPPSLTRLSLQSTPRHLLVIFQLIFHHAQPAQMPPINHLPMMPLRKAVINHTHSTQFSINFALCSSSIRKLTSISLCDDSQVILSRSTSPVQKVITAEKGVAIDFDSVSRDSKAQSKELYTWGQSEAEDLKDGKFGSLFLSDINLSLYQVTDRLAYLNFVQGSLASSLAIKLDSARASVKALRDAETALLPRRNIRAGIQNQIGRLEHAQQKGTEKNLSDLRGQLKKAEQDDLPLEREIELLKRKAVRESERLKWEAIREVGFISLSKNNICDRMPSSTARSWFSSPKQQHQSSQHCLRCHQPRPARIQVLKQQEQLAPPSSVL
jgi:hypothetical protein